MKRILKTDYHFYTPQQSSESSEDRNCFIPLNGTIGIGLEVRCPQPVTVNLITEDGETLFLDYGRVVSWSGKAEGFASVEIRGTDTFAYRVLGDGGKWFEVGDPTRLVVALDEPANKPVDDLVREGIQKYLGKLRAQGILDDVEMEELVDDVYNGEHEFDGEEDMFGLGHVEESEEELERRRQELLRAHGVHPEGPPPPAEQNPEARPGASGPAPAPATPPPPHAAGSVQSS